MAGTADETFPDSARRDFLQQMVTAGSVIAGAGLLGGCAGTAAATTATVPTPTPSQAGWDMSWTKRLRRYRTAYDSPEVQNGAALAFADAALAGYKQAMAVEESEVSPVLILRHMASVMVLNDAMWDRLGLGETQKLKAPTCGATCCPTST
jgi:hypothetical protein